MKLLFRWGGAGLFLAGLHLSETRGLHYQTHYCPTMIPFLAALNFRTSNPTNPNSQKKVNVKYRLTGKTANFLSEKGAAQYMRNPARKGLGMIKFMQSYPRMWRGCFP